MHGIRKHQPIGSLSSEFEIGLKLQKVENAWSKCFGDTWDIAALISSKSAF